MKTYTISEVSEMFHLKASTLRYYEETGILTDIERTEAHQRIYTEKHINRLKTICCFKGTGMSIAQLQKFFTYESKEAEHIDDILDLLTGQKEHVVKQMEQLQFDLEHVNRKLRYYLDIKKSLEEKSLPPCWKDYKTKIFKDI